ncbi:response regulator [Coemansia erecta]|uniref:Response regulator n=1 Tax=Coemansia erecta TaxID=147472 RepID=A0A9W7XYT3_9FUNG|nr:response regulator [Coemansia erecta]
MSLVPTLEIPIPVKRKNRKQRPEAIEIGSRNDGSEMENQPGESPPSPLIQVDARRKSQTLAGTELHRVDTTESSASASVLALQAKSSIDLERGAIDNTSISKTRSLLRDKMALFNRAKQKARNKFRGISDAQTAEEDDSVSVVPPNRSDTVDSEESLTTLPAEAAAKAETEDASATQPPTLQPEPLTPSDGRSENSDASSMKSRERKVLSSSSGGSGTAKKRISNPQPQPQPQLDSAQQQQPQKRSAGTANKNASGNVPPIRVLIVEDNLINRSIMERFLRHMDVYYDVASNGEEAITMWTAAAEEKRMDGASPGNAVEGPYHIVFMDIQMPIMDGITATKHIRGLERQRRIGVWEDKGSVARMAAGGAARPASLRWRPYRNNSGGSQAGDAGDQVLSLPVVKSPVIIVALTASSLQSDRHAALAAGCNDFLTKPVSLIWLKKKIMEWGCMQALVDHEGWQRWRTLRENGAVPSLAK